MIPRSAFDCVVIHAPVYYFSRVHLEAKIKQFLHQLASESCYTSDENESVNTFCRYFQAYITRLVRLSNESNFVFYGFCPVYHWFIPCV